MRVVVLFDLGRRDVHRRIGNRPGRFDRDETEADLLLLITEPFPELGVGHIERRDDVTRELGLQQLGAILLLEHRDILLAGR